MVKGNEFLLFLLFDEFVEAGSEIIAPGKTDGEIRVNVIEEIQAFSIISATIIGQSASPPHVKPPWDFISFSTRIEPILSLLQQIARKDTILLPWPDHSDFLDPQVPVPIPGKPNAVSHYEIADLLHDLGIKTSPVGRRTTLPRRQVPVSEAIVLLYFDPSRSFGGQNAKDFSRLLDGEIRTKRHAGGDNEQQDEFTLHVPHPVANLEYHQ